MGILHLKSCAKINIGLSVTGQRQDGYHNIETLFQEIDLCDEITFKQSSNSIIIKSDNPDLPLDKSNLMYQAFELFKNKASISDGIEIYIKKRIPMGGGLGGGSSNAATTLLAANSLWGSPFSTEQLFNLAQEIGSDVPFFITGGTAIGRGRGEELSFLEIPDDWFAVLVCPGISVSTKWAYGELKITLTNEKKITNFNALFTDWLIDRWQSDLLNDFETPVFNRYPELRAIKDKLYKMGAFYASMSGSGSTLYGLFKDSMAGQEAQKFFSNSYSSYFCRPITTGSTLKGKIRNDSREGGGVGNY